MQTSGYYFPIKYPLILTILSASLTTYFFCLGRLGCWKEKQEKDGEA